MIQHRVCQNKYGNGAHAGHDQDKPTHIKAHPPSSFLPLITDVKPSLISEVLELKPVFSPPTPQPILQQAVWWATQLCYPTESLEMIVSVLRSSAHLTVLGWTWGTALFPHIPLPVLAPSAALTADPSTALHQFLQLNLPPRSSFWWSYLQKWDLFFFF